MHDGDRLIRITKGQLKEMARREDLETFIRRLIKLPQPKKSLLMYLKQSPDPEGDISTIVKSWRTLMPPLTRSYESRFNKQLIDVALELGCKLDPDVVDEVMEHYLNPLLDMEIWLGLSNDPAETYLRHRIVERGKARSNPASVLFALEEYNLVWDKRFMEYFLPDCLEVVAMGTYMLVEMLIERISGTPWIDHPAVRMMADLWKKNNSQ